MAIFEWEREWLLTGRESSRIVCCLLWPLAKLAADTEMSSPRLVLPHSYWLQFYTPERPGSLLPQHHRLCSGRPRPHLAFWAIPCDPKKLTPSQVLSPPNSSPVDKSNTPPR